MFQTTTKRNKVKSAVYFTLILFSLSLPACAQSKPSSTSPETDADLPVEHVSVSFATDFTDRRRLVGFVDNVFIGEVVSQDGVRQMDDSPSTFFTVRVVENLKGELSGKVTVRQEGGFDSGRETLVLVEELPLILVGDEYLFSTLSRGSVDYHTIAAKYGAVPLSSMEPGARDAVIADFADAKTNQIPYSPQDTASQFEVDRADSDDGAVED